MKLSVRFMPHTVTVRPYRGQSSTGKLYGPEFALRCMAQGRRRLVRGSDGSETLSSLTIITEHGKAALIPAGSQVEWRGDTTDVIDSMDHDDGNLGAPQHTEVVCE